MTLQSHPPTVWKLTACRSLHPASAAPPASDARVIRVNNSSTQMVLITLAFEQGNSPLAPKRLSVQALLSGLPPSPPQPSQCAGARNRNFEMMDPAAPASGADTIAKQGQQLCPVRSSASSRRSTRLRTDLSQSNNNINNEQN